MALIPSKQFDFEKYGLKFIPSEEDLETYQRKVEEVSTTVEVWNFHGVITITLIDTMGRNPIIKKQYCKNQKQLEFLLFMGVAGAIFDPNYFITNERCKIFDEFIIKR